jgi:RPA family protein
MSEDGPSQREVAHRLFATEYDAATHSYAESDEERAPNYVVTPTGGRLNRIFVVGVLTEVEQVGDDILRARVADQTGVFVLYAGQYQPDEQAFLERADPPAFVAVTGKARTFQPEDTEQVYTSIRPESINHVDAETRDRFTVQAAEQSLERVKWAARALAADGSPGEMRAELERAGVDPGQVEGIERALDHYGTTTAYLDAVREMALDGARVVAGDLDEVPVPSVAPDAPGGPTPEALLERLGDVRPGGEPAGASDFAGDGTESSATADATGRETATTETEYTAASSTAETESTAGSTHAERDSETVAGADQATGAGSAREETTAAGATTADAGGSATEGDSAGSTEADRDSFDGQAETDDEFDPVEDEIGEFDPVNEELGGDDSDEIGEFDPEEDVLSDEEREDIEQEYGTEFQSGGDVETGGTAEMETANADTEQQASEGQAADAASTESGDVSSGSTSASEHGSTDAETVPEAESADPASASEPDTDDSGDAEDTQEAETPEDPQDAVLSLMEELDDGTGAERDAVLEAAGERHGLSTAEAEEAIQGALMDGKCYEPDDGSVKPI